MRYTQAIAEMYKGHKVTHRFFTSREYIEIKNGVIVTEEGYIISEDFWSYRNTNDWIKDWSIKTLESL